MKRLSYGLMGTLFIAAIALAGCGQRGLSIEDYHDLVLTTLKSEQEDSGFATMISTVLSDLECMAQVCIHRLRFEHLSELTADDRAQVAEYRGQICNEKKLQPPSQERQTHDSICSTLEEIFRELSAIQTTSAAALKLFSGGQDISQEPAVELALQGAAQNLAHSEKNLRDALQLLQQIAWLTSALPPLR